MAKKIMEVNTKLKDYVTVFDRITDNKILNKFKDVMDAYSNYEQAGIISDGRNGGEIEKKTRNAFLWPLGINLNSMTEVHWANFFDEKIWIGANKYCQKMKKQMNLTLREIQALKYEVGGHYVFHEDHCKEEPRTLSVIMFINDDYEGGNVVFHLPDENNKLTIEKKQGRMIIFPSNFMYRHAVEPVTKGVRYSVVSWLL